MELLGEFEITFYDDCKKCQGKWQGQTSSGKSPIAGECIAVDTDVIPMYTRVYIDGIGERIALDRGSAIKGNKIDVLVGSHDEAMTLGRKKGVKVYLLSQ
ncbi:MAG: 3D domain-containing protein [Cellulosilyticaceae bacterium]